MDTKLINSHLAWPIAFLSVLVLTGLLAGPAQAAPCTTVVVAPASIQDAINASGPKDTLCLSDGLGGEVFQDQLLVIGGAIHEGLTLKAVDNGTATLDGSGITDNFPAILIGNVDGVTIQGLTIQNYQHVGILGSGNSNDVVIEDNAISNVLTGVWTGQSFIGIQNTGWLIQNNEIVIGPGKQTAIQLGECSGCSVVGNILFSESHGILLSVFDLQADGEVMQGVVIRDNIVYAVGGGVSLFAQATFDHHSVTLQNVAIVRNDVLAGIVLGITSRVQGDPGAALVADILIARNQFACVSPPIVGFHGFGITLSKSGGAETDNISLLRNTVVDCVQNIRFDNEASPDDVTIKPPGSL